jgi:hypothetical protein
MCCGEHHRELGIQTGANLVWDVPDAVCQTEMYLSSVHGSKTKALRSLFYVGIFGPIGASETEGCLSRSLSKVLFNKGNFLLYLLIKKVSIQKTN